MTQAVAMIRTQAYASLDIVRISALVYAPNTASRRVLEKNGFALEGIAVDAITKNGKLYDAYLYADLRKNHE